MGAGHAALSVLRRPWLPALVLAAAGTLYALAFEPLPAALTAPPWSRALFARDGTLLDVSIASDEQWRLPLATDRVPARYARRHDGLQHSWLYPAIDTRPR